MTAERPEPARHCFGCGSENPRGLALKFRIEDGRAIAEFTAEPYLQGYPGLVHGGGVATVLDEAMSWAAYGRGIWAMTARMNVRFRRPVPVEAPLTIIGWIVRERGRFLESRSELRSKDGSLLAEADGLFARVGGREPGATRRSYEGWADGRQMETMTSLKAGRP